MTRISAARGAALVLALVCALALALAGCSSDGEDDPGPGGADPGGDSRVSAVGVSFVIPDGWRTVDAGEIADGAAESQDVQELAEGLGLDREQLEQAIAGVDLYTFSDEGQVDGFLDNINVTSPEGAVPDAAAIESEFTGLGATISETETTETQLGEVVGVSYQLPVGETTIQGQALVVDAEGSVVITVSTKDAALTETIAGQILDSLRAAD